MLWAILSAVAAGVACWPARPSFPVARVPGSARPSLTRRPAWLTAQALRLIGWTPAQVRWYQSLGAGLTGVAWFALTHSLLAAALMALIGWQLPVFWAELRAGRVLSGQLRQVSLFVETVADGVNAGQSIPVAIDNAAHHITEPPLGSATDTLIRRINSGTGIVAALQQMGESVQWAWWDLFVDLVDLVQRTGGSGTTFDALSWQLQEQDRIQSEFRTLVSVFLTLVLVFLLLTIGGQIGSALLNPSGWAAMTHRFAVLLIGAAAVSAFCFGGVRRYTRMMVQIEEGS